MNHNRTEGAKQQAAGTIKEGVGKLTGDKSQELKGSVQKNAGKVQREAGKASDNLRDQSRRT